MTNFSKVLVFVFAVAASLMASENASPRVKLLTERHRTEWNWVEYRIKLTNVSDSAIQDPEISYYAENTNIQYCESRENDPRCLSVRNDSIPSDTMLDVAVDWSSLFNPVQKSVESYGKVTVVTLGFKGKLRPGKSMNVNFRLFKKNWAKWDCSRDPSYQKNPAIQESNYLMAVYDGSHNMVWGYNPINGQSVADAFLWSDRNGITPVEQYDGDTSAVQKAGRFWMIKNSSLNQKEERLLKRAGLAKISAVSKKSKMAILFKSSKNVKKRLLDSLVYGFYNSFGADDSSKLKVEYEPNDWLGEKDVCETDGSCHKVVWNKSSIDMATICWDDVSIGDCREIVKNCGGNAIEVDLYAIYSKNTKENIECLASNKNVRRLDVIRPEEPTNNIGRNAVNIENLQLNEWVVDFSLDKFESNWLSGQRFTGEHVVVGIYDTGMYFDHDGFNEWENGVKKARRAEFSATEFPDLEWCENGCLNTEQFFHATHVAGIVGGNGGGSTNHMYRGVAPKVKFYSGPINSMCRQMGHVVNHSHLFLTPSYYEPIERGMFENWKNKTYQYKDGSQIKELKVSDGLPKTYVASAGNSAKGYQLDREDPCYYGKGFHSVSHNTKNGIVVGNYAGATGIPHTSSSYGPTWDGRIKPDLMAPGSGEQVVYNSTRPFVAYIDYIRIIRKGLPEIDLDVGRNERLYVDPDFGNCSGNNSCNYVEEISLSNLLNVPDVDAVDGYSLKWENYNPAYVNNMISWKYNAFTSSPFTIQKGDEIEIRMRLPADTRNIYEDKPFAGKVHLKVESDKSEKSYKFVELPFEKDIAKINDGYFKINVKNDDEDLVSTVFKLEFLMIEHRIMSSVPIDEHGGTGYEEETGTSMAAPYVSGIVALMNQSYNEIIGSKLNSFNAYETGLRNSTSKAILIHTAHDMEDTIGFSFSLSYDVNAAMHDNKFRRVTYGKGPDFVTGWGSVDGGAALGMFDSYDVSKKQFLRFREIEVGKGADKRFSINVGYMKRLRLTLAWDDAPGDFYGKDDDDVFKRTKKLQNDLDMYLISPSGKYYFPWRLDPLSTEHLDENGIESKKGCVAGLENITEEAAKKPAYRDCPVNSSSDPSCFDHLNNVEVVDVDYPERGVWTVVVRANEIVMGNGANGGQIASIASDVPLDDNPGNIGCDMDHPYMPQSEIKCTYDFGNSLANYVTFYSETFAGAGDYIQLSDADGNLIGTYTGDELAGKRMRIYSNKLNVTLNSDNDENTVGYGFAIERIEVIPYSMLFGI